MMATKEHTQMYSLYGQERLVTLFSMIILRLGTTKG